VRPVDINSGPNHYDLIDAARKKIPSYLDWPASYNVDAEEITLVVQPDNSLFFSKAKDIEIFFAESGLVSNSAPLNIVQTSSSLVVTQKSGELETYDIPHSDVVISYYDYSGTRHGVLVSASFQENLVTPINTSTQYGFLAILLFALLGGIILNLMPCVFPVLSLKALKLITIKNHSLAVTRMHGIAYTSGVVISFLLIAILLIILKHAGQKIGWGFQLQTPEIIMALTYLIFLIGLNLLGCFELSGRFINIGNRISEKNGFKGSFLTGVLATIVATPCTAPFMGVAIGYALTQSPLISLGVFTALALGLALPYLMLCFFPSLQRALPKPGAWMQRFKESLSFPMFLTTAWLVWVFNLETNPTSTFLLLIGLVLLSFAIWALRLSHKKLSKILVIISIVAALSLLGIINKTAPSNQVSTSSSVIAYSPTSLAQALSSSDPVFVNMTAAWCRSRSCCRSSRRAPPTPPRWTMCSSCSPSRGAARCTRC
jgi:thiol:disulfide interchange protein DsbD